MTTLVEHSAILTKTKELCSQIAKDSEFLKLYDDVERFLKDDSARLQYQSVHEKGEELHHKQNAGVELGAAEIRDFEAARDALFNNQVASDFMAAQKALESLQKEIGQYVSMTLELGRLPTDDEISASNSGGCCGGGGCGC